MNNNANANVILLNW